MDYDYQSDDIVPNPKGSRRALVSPHASKDTKGIQSTHQGSRVTSGGRWVTRPSPKTVTISSRMSAYEIAMHLSHHGCKNITSRLDKSSYSAHPLFNGGFGDVYRGRLKTGAMVAIKTVRFQTNPSEAGQKTLKNAARELHTWSKCQHPNVVELLGLVEFRGQIGMVSLWMKNGNLPTYLTQHPDADRCQMSIHISEGLVYLHGNNIIHGDLKGFNVLVSNEGTPMLSDFGNAVLAERTLQFTHSAPKDSLSPRWAAPEIIAGSETYSFAADVYALGMTILETITGNIPYFRKSNHAVYFAVAVKREHPERPEDVIPPNSQDGNTLWLMMTTCWAYEADARPSSSHVLKIMKTITREGLRRIPVEVPPSSTQAGRPADLVPSATKKGAGLLAPSNPQRPQGGERNVPPHGQRRMSCIHLHPIESEANPGGKTTALAKSYAAVVIPKDHPATVTTIQEDHPATVIPDDCAIASTPTNRIMAAPSETPELEWTAVKRGKQRKNAKRRSRPESHSLDKPSVPVTPAHPNDRDLSNAQQPKVLNRSKPQARTNLTPWPLVVDSSMGYDPSVPADEEFRQYFAFRSAEIKGSWKVILRYSEREGHTMNQGRFIKALEAIGFRRSERRDGMGKPISVFTPMKLKTRQTIAFHLLYEASTPIELRDKATSIRTKYPAMVRAMYDVWNSSPDSCL